MGFLNQNREVVQQGSERQILEAKYANSRHNTLLVVIFSVINMALLLTNADTYFLFSAYVPYLLTDIGMLMCGMYPEEFYVGELSAMEFLGKGFLGVMLAIAGVILLLYLLSWIFSKKNRVGWMIFTLVFFAIDTALLLLLNGIVLEMAVDYLIHAWVIISLAKGISAYYKAKKLPEDPVSEQIEEVVQVEQVLTEE